MAYAKFITMVNSEGKKVRYGPYYYRSVRTPEGKVRNIYIGMTPEEAVAQPQQQAPVPEVRENESVAKETGRVKKFLARLVNS